MKALIEKFRLYGPKKFLTYSLSEVYKIAWTQKMRNSFSQSAEDIWIDKLLDNKKNGFYVDVGAYDPNRFSNTKRFYLKGWRGINIEPDINNYKKFVKARKRDINLNLGIGAKKGKLTFFRFFPDTLSTFSDTSATQYMKEGFQLIEEIPVVVKPLKDVLKEYCKEKKIDFLTVDTEGLDMEVLKSNDWNLFRPKVICAETTVPSGRNTKRSSRVEDFLLTVGYQKRLDIASNSLFADSK